MRFTLGSLAVGLTLVAFGCGDSTHGRADGAAGTTGGAAGAAGTMGGAAGVAGTTGGAGGANAGAGGDGAAGSGQAGVGNDGGPGGGTAGGGAAGSPGDGAADVADGAAGQGMATGGTSGQSFTIGGTVSGLVGTGLVLVDNAGDDLTIAANGAFTFATAVPAGATFTVTVKTQPSAPAQTCQVSGGSGTVSGAITSVAVNCAVDSYTIGGTVSGLAGTGLVLQNDAGDDLQVTGNGSFAFATPIHSGDPFAVTIKTQPAFPTQTCSVSQGSGTVANGVVSTVAVACVTNTYLIGGSVTGLTGAGLVLQDNGGDNRSISANGTFTFAAPVASGAPYAVTVLAPPSSPSQACTVTTGAGTVGTADVLNVAVTCTTKSFTIGGTVVGLVGSGLVLRNESGDDLAVTASGGFEFATPAPSGSAFAVTIAAQPADPAQTCVVSGGTGTVGGEPATGVIVNCSTDQHVVGGTLTGLAGTGLALSLNGGSAFAVTSTGPFAFPTTIPSGGAYDVTIVSQPIGPSQTCTIAGGTGHVAAVDISSVAVTCTTNTFSVGGTVKGLAGAGLVLRDDDGDDLAIGADGTFVFSTKITSGQAYAVTVHAQPSSPSQTCVVANASGTMGAAAVGNVAVTCTTNVYAVGGTLSGLAGTVILAVGGGDSLTLTANGPFAFPKTIASGSSYAVAVSTQPASPDQTCAVTNGSGTVAGAAVTDVVVTCITNKYRVGGALIGLAGGGLVLQDDAGDDLTVPAGATTFTFAAAVDSGGTYAVTIKTQPSSPTQSCSVVGGTGTVGASDVGSVIVNCSTNSYVIGGTVKGLYGDGLVLQNNGAGDLAISGSGTFAFAAPMLSGQAFAVTAKTQPTDPWQTCTVAGGSGTVGGGNVSAQVTCVSNPSPVSVSVTGLVGTGLVLQDNAADNLPVASDGTYTFATGVRSGLTYAVTVLSQPTDPWQTCTVAMPAGAIADAGVTLSVTCTTNVYTVGGTITGLTGNGLVLRNNGGDDLALSGSGTFTFATPVASGAAYSVTVGVAPSSPAQSCVVTNGGGLVTALKVTNVAISCANTAICATAAENATLSLSCPPGHTIASIDFASYGTSTGTCGAFATSSCNAATSLSVVRSQCLGQTSCSVPATNATFGDPCVSTIKSLAVQGTCS